MSTDVLLFFGAGSAVVFVVMVTVEGARRPGYDWMYHTGRELELGPGGWIQRVNFILVGAGFTHGGDRRAPRSGHNDRCDPGRCGRLRLGPRRALRAGPYLVTR